MDKVNLEKKFGLFNEYWSPKIIGDLNDSYVKIAKFKGEFTWHMHENEDEMFYVVKGLLTVKLKIKTYACRKVKLLLYREGLSICPLLTEKSKCF